MNLYVHSQHVNWSICHLNIADTCCFQVPQGTQSFKHIQALLNSFSWWRDDMHINIRKPDIDICDPPVIVRSQGSPLSVSYANNRRGSLCDLKAKKQVYYLALCFKVLSPKMPRLKQKHWRPEDWMLGLFFFHFEHQQRWICKRSPGLIMEDD